VESGNVQGSEARELHVVVLVHRVKQSRVCGQQLRHFRLTPISHHLEPLPHQQLRFFRPFASSDTFTSCFFFWLAFLRMKSGLRDFTLVFFEPSFFFPSFLLQTGAACMSFCSNSECWRFAWGQSCEVMRSFFPLQTVVKQVRS